MNKKFFFSFVSTAVEVFSGAFRLNGFPISKSPSYFCDYSMFAAGGILCSHSFPGNINVNFIHMLILTYYILLEFVILR